MLEDLEGIAVIPVQTILGSKPHESLDILEDTGRRALGKPLLRRDVVEPDILLGISFGDKRYREKDRAQNSTTD